MTIVVTAAAMESHAKLVSEDRSGETDFCARIQILVETKNNFLIIHSRNKIHYDVFQQPFPAVT